ncbi:MAG: prolyl oligopeptidase family serine peptidase, partial [Prolixibacteraceae bacterium]|nr:prolyl oligopeptidase family serine peptidase [Prolixibacteraceae bacterium]
GPFPGVVVMAGHYINGRLGGVQSLGYELALNGYVAMTIDPWGAGERTTEYLQYEYHGSNLGASLMNIGQSLLALQITDNMRGVDLLCSLPYVDPEKIGATGASGGGNQTMWLAAMDERVKAAVPVVSVGTFESYVMGHNCICETLIDGLTITEESGVLALVAPRALLLSNGLKDSNTAFYPSEMLRSFNNAKQIFKLYNAEEKFSHLIFDGPHSYPRETRDAMLKLFNTYLKDAPDAEIKVITRDDMLREEDIINFPDGQRDQKIMTTAGYCIKKGTELRAELLNAKSFDNNKKTEELKDILKLNEEPKLSKVHQFQSTGGWDRYALETSDGKLIPLLHLPPLNDSEGYVIMCNPDGVKSIPVSDAEAKYNKGQGVVLVDLSGTGEASSFMAEEYDKLAKLHSLGRSEIWLGKRVLGEWVKELNIVTGFLIRNQKLLKYHLKAVKRQDLQACF